MRKVTTTRGRILAMLRRGPVTVDQLARETAVTPNAVRAQLAILEDAGMVRRQGVLRRDAVGQPPAAYAISAAGDAQFSKAYSPALTALATALERTLAPAELKSTFSTAGRLLAAERPRDPQQDAADLAVSLLEELGGLVSVTRSGDLARIDGTSCPLAAAVRRCPASCEMVRSLLAAATGAVVTTVCQHGDTPKCGFEVVAGRTR